MADASDSREQPVLDSVELEMKKKRLLVELQSALAPKDPADKTVTAPPNPSSLALGIEVIDETALLDSVAKTRGSKQQQPSSRRRAPKNNNNHKKTDDSIARPRPKPKPKPKPKCGIHKYSRKELEALRFVNMAQQRKFWKAIHAAFGIDVANEYDTLTSTHNPLPHNKLNKPIIGVAATNGRWRYMNVFVH